MTEREREAGAEGEAAGNRGHERQPATLEDHLHTDFSRDAETTLEPPVKLLSPSLVCRKSAVLPFKVAR